MSRPTGIFVLGNHDAVVAGKMSPDVFNDSARRLILWTRDRIGPRGARFLGQLPLVLDDTASTLKLSGVLIDNNRLAADAANVEFRDCRVQMFDRMDTDLGSFQITAAVQRVAITTPGRNLRCFEIDTLGNAVSVVSRLPGQGLLADCRLNLFRENRRLYFPVPRTAENVFAEITPEEPAEATLLDASGNPVAAMPLQTAAMVLSARHRPADDAQSSPEIWTLKINATEDIELRLGSATTPIFAVEPSAGLVVAH